MPTPSEVRRLTPKQRGVLELVAAGEPDKAIAKRINKSPSLVHKRVRELHATLGTENRVQLTLVAISYGLAATPPRRALTSSPGVTSA
jgi:DNA-binding NarL/FixJ family response regulator